MNDHDNAVGLHSIPTELTGTLPRQVRATGNGIYLTILAPICLVLAVSTGLWGMFKIVQQARNRAALRHDSIAAIGEVTRRQYGKGSDFISYIFSVNGTSYTGTCEVPGFYSRDKSLAILYVATNPGVNHPAAFEWSLLYWPPPPPLLWIRIPEFSSELQWMLGPFIFGPVGLLLLLSTRKEQKLLAEGLASNATITESSQKTRTRYFVRYKFQTKEGTIVQGSCSDGPKEIGATYCVLYLPQNPKQNMPYRPVNYRIVK